MTWRRRSRPAGTSRTSSGTSGGSSWRSCRSGCSLSATWIRRDSRWQIDGFSARPTRRSWLPRNSSRRSASTKPPSPASSSRGAISPTGTWRQSSRASQRRPLLRATPPLLRPCWRSASTPCSGCYIQSCHSSPKSCGRSFPADSPKTFLRERPGLPCQRPCRSSGRTLNSRAFRRRSPRSGRFARSTASPLRRALQPLSNGERDTIMRLAQLSELQFDGSLKGAGGHAVLADGSEVFVALADAIDLQQECRRLSGELTRLEQQLAGLAAKLTNQQFVARAPAEVVAKEREKERAWRDQRQVLADKLKSLGCS